MIRYHSIDSRGSVTDGPGVRTVVFLQGCDRHCPNCHNPSTWNRDAGILTTEGALRDEILKSAPTKRVTISGGEPMLQAGAVEKLIALLKEAGLDVALYTSCERSEIPKAILDHLDYLKTGPYVDALRTTVTPYVGSTNQRFEKLHEEKEERECT